MPKSYILLLNHLSSTCFLLCFHQRSFYFNCLCMAIKNGRYALLTKSQEPPMFNVIHPNAFSGGMTFLSSLPWMLSFHFVSCVSKCQDSYAEFVRPTVIFSNRVMLTMKNFLKCQWTYDFCQWNYSSVNSAHISSSRTSICK